MAAPLTIFKWGYWGWGNATKELVRLVDAIESKRGFKPPLFVDIRIRRSVQAEGFRDDKFEQTVGKSRYRWMRDLGNQSVIDKNEQIKIRRPEAAAELLDLAQECAREGQRIIYFCSCEWPCYCHRTTVAKLLVTEARRRRHAVEVVEWPGGEPDMRPQLVTVSPKSMRRFRKSGYLALDGKFDPIMLGGLAVGSLVTAEAPDTEPITFASCPAIIAGGQWKMSSIWNDDDELMTSRKEIDAWRRDCGYAAHSYAPPA
jgi:hypothetical protein